MKALIFALAVTFALAAGIATVVTIQSTPVMAGCDGC
jgi:hypothetical protein